ncbi:CHAT domain-containing protein [Azospirillum halopraeferens]|uniref:CHAT domain-containing protein n=1 Tax=Azospirillum halopraeferens TaxID=34010 RepID=UPI00040BEE16|nr:CHAT domain-containing protein [Azospirillum halopraeferens]
MSDTASEPGGPRRGERRRVPAWRRATAVLLTVALTGCGSALFVVDRSIGERQQEAQGIDAGVRQAIADGALAPLRQRLAARPTGALSLAELNLLCDLHLKAQAFKPAEDCNEHYRRQAEQAGDQTAAAAARRRGALLFLAQGRFEAARDQLRPDAGVHDAFLHALAIARYNARTGEPTASTAVADSLARHQKPEPVYFAASLYAEYGDCANALRLLRDPNRRLLDEYGLGDLTSGRRTTFRLDLVGGFEIGYLGTHSHAPAANVHVEFLAARCLFALGHTTEASRYLDRLRTFPHIAAYAGVHWQVLHLSGRLEQNAGHPAAAAERYRAAIAVIEQSRSAIAGDPALAAFEADTGEVYGDLFELQIAQRDTEGALETIERAKGRLLVERLANVAVLVPHDTTPDRAADLLAARRNADQILRLQTSAPGVADALREQRAVLARIERNSPVLARMTGAQPRRWRELLPPLQPGQAAIVYVAVRNHWHALVIEGDRITAHRAPGPAPVGLEVFLESLQTSEGTGYERLARRLYDHLIRPVLAVTDARDLLVVPFGSLFAIPLGALHDGERPLAATHRLRVVPSLSALAALRPDDGARRPPRGLVLANPLRQDPGKDWSLPHAEEEADAIRRIFPQTTPYIRADATVDRLAAGVRGKSFLHIAAHGTFNRNDPMKSRLLLAGTPADGDLTVEQIHALHLPVAMAVLSACESALRERATGDDLLSLAESFLAAGARTVVGSHWKVDDSASARLMAHFYEALRRGEPAAEAMSTARVAMMREKPHPYFWAGFSVIGADGRM